MDLDPRYKIAKIALAPSGKNTAKLTRKYRIETIHLTGTEVGTGLTMAAADVIVLPAKSLAKLKLDKKTNANGFVLSKKTARISPTLAPIFVGDSAYAIAVKNGFVGTEQEWLDSLGSGGTGGTSFAPNPDEIDDTGSTDIFYFGWNELNGGWLVREMQTLTAAKLDAQESNNPTHSTLADAWTDRANLNYA